MELTGEGRELSECCINVISWIVLGVNSKILKGQCNRNRSILYHDRVRIVTSICIYDEKICLRKIILKVLSLSYNFEL